tara:strand:+ start:362 stop:529 length:168 start_codon:yes stop_codon:yes gene_type:complete
MICIDIERERLTFEEAMRNLGEMYHSLDLDHRAEVVRRVLQLDPLYREQEEDDGA